MNLANPLPFFLPSRACTQRGGGGSYRQPQNRTRIAAKSDFAVAARIICISVPAFRWKQRRSVDGVASTRLWGGGGKEENECGARGNKAVGMSCSGEGLEGGRGRSGWIYDTLGDAFFFFFSEPSINLHNACALRPINARRGWNIFFFFSKTLIRMFVAFMPVINLVGS